MQLAIETVDLGRRFGSVHAVEALNLQVPTGSVCALIGPNGAGKTTTIKLLMNLMRPSEGTALVLGRDSRRLGPSDFVRIGYVSENQRQPEWMTPDQFLAYVRPLYPTWDEALCRKLQNDLGLTLRTPLRSLSRGTRMKVALLASLAYRPELIVLDEPFSGLDPLVRDELIRALLELAGERQWTAFISSHDIDEVERLADSIAFIDGGRLVFAEAVSSLLNRFRRIEIVVPDGITLRHHVVPTWVMQETAGRTLRFVDTAHNDAAAFSRIASAFAGGEIQATPMSLREIFVTLARRSSLVNGRAEEGR